LAEIALGPAVGAAALISFRGRPSSPGGRRKPSDDGAKGAAGARGFKKARQRTAKRISKKKKSRSTFLGIDSRDVPPDARAAQTPF